ncbi:MAG: YfhO family protein, partial [Lachnospiraceae bacterium]|nr:YfhO family protein [Lachnospiraceae bacterium]
MTQNTLIPAGKKKWSFRTFAPYLTAFLLPVLVMLVVFIERGIYPFGEKCFLRTDLYHQYAPFFKELNNKLQNGGSLFYSWNIGGGTNFWTLSAYYLASPLNILVALCPSDYIIEFVTWTIVLKLGMCSATVTYYLNKRHGAEGLAAYPAAFFGTFYALSGFMAAYQWNVMWLDCLWLFPLIILGLERLVKENRGMLYCVTLAFCILSNYYISIMVCLGVACYCFFLLGTERLMLKQFGVKLLKFILYTLIAFAFSAVYLLPYIAYFNTTASATSTFKWEWYSYFSVFDMVTRHLMNVQVHTGLDHWPNIYCGVAVFMGLPFYYLNRKITLREKIGYTVLLIFFYFSFSTRAMDYIWHGLHIPNSLPCRQSFVYIFLVLVMCYRGFLGIRERTFRDIAFTMLLALVFVFAAEKLADDKTIYTNYVIYISALFILLYAVLIYVYRKGKAYKDVLVILMLALCCVENCINTSITSVPTVTRADYTEYDETVGEIMTQIRKDRGDSFFRAEKAILRTKNDGAWLDFPSISTFSSVADYHVGDFYKILGMEASFNAYGSNGQTPFTNMLFGVNYTVSYQDMHGNEELYTLVGTNNQNVWIYENKYALPPGFVLDPMVAGEWPSEGLNYLEVQNEFAERISGVANLFENVTPAYVTGKEVTLTVPRAGYYYVYTPKSGPTDIQVTRKNASIKTWSSLNRGYIISVGYCEDGEAVTFKNTQKDSTRTLNLTLYRLQDDLMPQVYEAFAKSGYQVTHFEDTLIEGYVDVKEAGTFVTTIAAEDGWEVFVDGKPMHFDTWKDAYICFYLEEGHHDITFKFHVVYFKEGLILTVSAGVLMLLIGVISTILRKRKEKKEEEAALEALEEAAAADTPADPPAGRRPLQDPVAAPADPSAGRRPLQDPAAAPAP